MDGLVLWFGQLADLTSTLVALERGAVEANPILPDSAAGIVAVKLGSTLAIDLLLHRLAKRHPRLSRALHYVVGALGLIPAILNAKRS